MSLTAYAKRRGVSAVAVSKAVAAGRLVSSLVRVGGAPKIADPELADREWEANTRPRIDHPAPQVPDPPRLPAPPRPLPDPAPDLTPTPLAPRRQATPDVPEVPDYNISRALREAAAARKEAAHADIAELDAAERKGELVPVDEARAEVLGRYALVRTRLLGVPSRVAQRLPHLAGEVVPVLDELLRDALEELADGDVE